MPVASVSQVDATPVFRRLLGRLQQLETAGVLHEGDMRTEVPLLSL